MATEMPSPSDSHRRRKKDPDRERSSPKSKDKDRHKSGKPRKTRSSTSKDGDAEGDRPKERPQRDRTRTPSTAPSSISQKMSVVPEMERRGSLGSTNASRTSLPYPTLSKTYAKENIYSREELERQKATSTLEAIDIGASPGQGADYDIQAVPLPPNRAAPTPPRAPPSPRLPLPRLQT